MAVLHTHPGPQFTALGGNLTNLSPTSCSQATQALSIPTVRNHSLRVEDEALVVGVERGEMLAVEHLHPSCTGAHNVPPFQTSSKLKLKTTLNSAFLKGNLIILVIRIT